MAKPKKDVYSATSTGKVTPVNGLNVDTVTAENIKSALNILYGHLGVDPLKFRMADDKKQLTITGDGGLGEGLAKLREKLWELIVLQNPDAVATSFAIHDKQQQTLAETLNNGRYHSIIIKDVTVLAAGINKAAYVSDNSRAAVQGLPVETYAQKNPRSFLHRLSQIQNGPGR